MSIRAIIFLFIIHFSYNSFSQSNSWKETLENEAGTINLYWNVSKPFIFKNEKDQLSGIEAEFMEGFVKYLRLRHDVKLKLNWIDTESFIELYDYVKTSDNLGDFGVSAFSITEDRRKEVLFTDPYMSDVAVMISRNDIPMMTSVEEFKRISQDLIAITVAGTTYEKQLKYIKKELNTDFLIHYIDSDEVILDHILSTPNSFGYVDLPLYLIALKNNPSAPLFRQNLYSVKGHGYGIIMPQGSDWGPILNEYINSPYFLSLSDQFISKYLEEDIYKIVKSMTIGENVNADEIIILLNKEKEIQNQELLQIALSDQQDEIIKYILIIGIFISFLGLIFFYKLYRSKQVAISNLELHKEKIEHQQNNIESANVSLLTLNEEKNNLIRILAHDLRSPINQVAGLAEILLLDKKKLSNDQIELIEQMINSSNRLREMISKILDVDAIESREMNIKMVSVNLTKVFRELQIDFEPDAKNKHIKLIFFLEKNLTFISDEVFINQILGNLISNAIKFSNANSSINIDATKSDGYIEISVSDTGPGFTKEDQKNMYKKFQRLSAQPTAGEQSTGLGLSIVKMFTELIGGSIDYKTKIGEGTTFILKFKES